MQLSIFLRTQQILRKLKKSSAEDQQLIAELFLALSFFRIILLLCPFRHLQKLARFLATNLSCRGSLPEQRFRLAHFCTRFAVFPPFSNCLVQALAFSFCLTRREIEHQVHIGVKKSAESSFSAHAWVTCNGETLIGGTTSPTTYQEILRIAPANQ